MKSIRASALAVFLLILAVMLLLTTCGKESTANATVATTSDPCAPQNIVAEIQKVHDLMREFDDASQLASYTQRDQLVLVIPSLQTIRRRSEDQLVPACLDTLKTLQLQHMNTVINTLMNFLDPNSDPNVSAQGIAQARSQREQYSQEMARLVGATYVPPQLSPTGSSNNTPVSPSE